MNKIKKRVLALFVGLSLLIPGLARAQDSIIINPLQYSTLQELIEKLTNFILVLALAIAPLIILVGAFYIMTGGGDPDRVKKGKSIILWAVIGLAIILLSKALLSVLKYLLGGTGGGSVPSNGGGPQIPR